MSQLIAELWNAFAGSPDDLWRLAIIADAVEESGIEDGTLDADCLRWCAAKYRKPVRNGRTGMWEWVAGPTHFPHASLPDAITDWLIANYLMEWADGTRTIREAYELACIGWWYVQLDGLVTREQLWSYKFAATDLER